MPKPDYERWYRADLPSFIKLAFNELSPQKPLIGNWHLDVIADALQGCLERGCRRLILNHPPRSLKSHCASVAMPVFALGHDPMRKIMVIAGSQALASDLQRKALALMRTSRCRTLFPHLQPTEAANEILLPHGGGIFFTIVGKSLIGRGADIVVIDDPLEPAKALDRVARRGVNAWFDAEVLPRLNDKSKGIIILVMQRLHQDDLTNHVRKTNSWKTISLPAIALNDEKWALHNRKAATRLKRCALHSDRENKDQLRQILFDIGAYNFAAQYLQSPMDYPGKRRSGLFHEPRPADWTPEMGLGKMWLGSVSEIAYTLYEVFGEGEPPLYASVSSPYTHDEWSQAAVIQQQRLVSECRDVQSSDLRPTDV